MAQGGDRRLSTGGQRTLSRDSRRGQSQQPPHPHSELSPGPPYLHHHHQQLQQQQQQQHRQHPQAPSSSSVSNSAISPASSASRQPGSERVAQPHQPRPQQQAGLWRGGGRRDGGEWRGGEDGRDGGTNAGAVRLEMGIRSMAVAEEGFVVQTVEILKRPGQTLGFYIREGNGFDRQDGVFISRIQMGTVAESNGLLHVGDEILTVNGVRVAAMSLDDVVILMSIPKKLVLAVRTRRSCGGGKNKSCPSLALTEREDPPIVVLKKGRSSSATALELTERSPDGPEAYSHPSLHGAEFGVPRREAGPSSSRYASIFISPQLAEARLLPDETLDSGNSSDGSLPRSVDSGKRVYSGGAMEDGGGESPVGFVSPSGTMVGQYGLAGQDYARLGLGEGTSRRGLPKSPCKAPTPGARLPCSHLTGEGAPAYVGAEPYYANAQAFRDHLAQRYQEDHVGHYGYPEDRSRSQDRLRDMFGSRSRYRLVRSRSPECYNSDSEVIYTHPRTNDARGFASDLETYAGATSDDDGPVYAVPHIPASSSTELQTLLRKFTSLSAELQHEQNRLQWQLSSRDKTPTASRSSTQMSLARPLEAEDYSSLRSVGPRAASPSPSRRAASTQTPGGIASRMQRKEGVPYRGSEEGEGGGDRSASERGHPTGKLPSSGLHGSRQGISSSGGTGGLGGGVPLASVAPGGSAERRVYETPVRAASAARFRELQLSRKPLHIPYSEFEPYKADIRSRVETSRSPGLDGMLAIHVMSGQGLKSSKTSLRDLYCVVAVDSVNKARTMIRTGAINFDWDEAFDVELEDSKEISFLIYHWDPHLKHRLCFHGAVLLPGFTGPGQRRHVAVKMEPKGLLFVTLLYKEPAVSLQRLPSLRQNGLFGAPLEAVVTRENTNVPAIVRKCIEEVERRGLETVGIYRLCGSARRKALLREAFEKNAQAVDLSPENVSDIHVVTGVFKDYLRELPEPLFTNALYQMLLDALSVRLPSDPEGSAVLMLSILECLPKANQDTMEVVLNHLKKVAAHSDKNKMVVESLAVCWGPVLLCPSPASLASPAGLATSPSQGATSSPSETRSLSGSAQATLLDFKKHIEVLRYLLEIWDATAAASTTVSKSGTAETVVSMETLGSGGGEAGGSGMREGSKS